MEQIPVSTDEGIYLGHAPAYRVETRRVQAAASRIVRGLYAHFMEKRLPETHELSVFPIDLQKGMDPFKEPELAEILSFIGKPGVRHKAADAFEVWYEQSLEDPDATAWYVRLASAFGIVALTAPKEEPEQ